ncbi:MAG TPA: hypothetical protein VKT75_10455 [Acidobacteriaceae bacterium]|nr:hypothetical protein [Acidobacteriaceae bacterium]
MASIKATLTVALKANHVVVAELEDANLWQRLLTGARFGDATHLKRENPTPAAAAAGPKEWSVWSEQAK